MLPKALEGAIGTYPDVSNLITKLNKKNYSKTKDLDRIAMMKRLKDFFFQ